MEQEHPVVGINVADGSAGLAVRCEVGKLIVIAEGLAVAAGANASGQVEFLPHHIVPYPVNDTDVLLVPGEGRNVGYAGIHVLGTHRMPDGLGLLEDGDMRLAIGVHALLAPPAHVKEELCLVQVFLVPCDGIEFGQGHLGDLMAGDFDLLVLPRTDLPAHAVRILDGDIKEIALARRPIMGDGPLHHVAEVIKLVTVLDLSPTLLAGPSVGMLRVAGPCGIKVAVRLLCRSDYHQDAVDVRVQTRIGICLHEIRSSLYGLVHVRVIERQTSDDET